MYILCLVRFGPCMESLIDVSWTYDQLFLNSLVNMFRLGKLHWSFCHYNCMHKVASFIAVDAGVLLVSYVIRKAHVCVQVCPSCMECDWWNVVCNGLMRWDTTSRRRGGSLCQTVSITIVSLLVCFVYTTLPEAPVTINVCTRCIHSARYAGVLYLVSTKFVGRTLTSGASLQAPSIGLKLKCCL